MKESGDLMTEASALVVRVLERELSRARSDIRDIRSKVSEELSRFFFKQTKRRPLIMVVVTLA